MKLFWMIAIFIGPCLSASAADEKEIPAPVETALPTNVIARINGEDIPGDWFTHEFRSTFFRHLDSGDVRQTVFGPFMNRMMLNAKAREMGFDKRPELRAAIDQRISDMRAFMDYQLAMTEIDMMNDALVKELGLSITPEDVTEKDIEKYYNENVRSMPGAPASLSLVPAQIMDALKAKTAQKMTEDKLNDLLQSWRGEMTVTINSNLVESVPMPEMKGNVPEGVGDR